MKSNLGQFNEEAYLAFEETALDKYDFTTCQRPDGSKYGSNGRCIKGSETSPASKDDKKSSSKSSGGGANSKSGEGPSQKKLSPTQEARQSKDPKVQQRVIQNDIKKLSKEYEKLRGKPEAAARRSEIMKEVDGLMKKTKAIDKQLSDAAKSQSPKQSSGSLPAQQRRSSAAARAKD